MPDLIDLSDIGAKLSTDNNPQTKSPFDLSDIGATPASGQTEQPSVEEFGGSEFGRAAARSHLVATSGIANFARLFGDTDSGLLKDIADNALKEASMIPTKAGSIKDVLKDPTLAPAYVARVLGELAPQAVLAYLTGGTGAALGRAAGLGVSGVRAATGAGAAVTSIPQEVGHMYEESGSKAAALAYGIPSGALDALSAERIIGKVFRAGSEEAGKRAWRQIVRDTIKDIPKSAGVESVTEATQEALALLANKSADDTYKLLTPDNGWRILESAVAGAIGGGVLGGGMEAVQLPAQKAERSQRAQDIRLTRQIRDTVRQLQREQPPASEPSEQDLEYAGGEMPRTGLWPEAPQRLTRSVEEPPRTVMAQPAVQEPSEQDLEYHGGEMPRTGSWPETPQKTAAAQSPSGPEPYRVLVTPDREYNGETLPGGISVQAEGNARSGEPRYWRSIGFNVPDVEGLPGGVYSYGEYQMLAAMNPVERRDFLSKRKPSINENPPQAPAVPVEAPAKVAAPSQTQSVPTDTKGVRDSKETVPAQPQEEFIEVTDLSTIKTAGDMTKYRTPIYVIFDPITTKGGEKRATQTEALIAISPNNQSIGKLVIQIRVGKSLKTVWSANLSDLEQAGIAESIGGGKYKINQSKLYSSAFLAKNPHRDYQAYRLPGERLEGELGVDPQDAINEIKKLSPFGGAILQNLSDSGTIGITTLRNLGTVLSGARKKVASTSKVIARNGVSGLSRIFRDEARKLASGETTSPSDSRRITGLLRAAELVDNPSGNFSEADAQAAASALLAIESFQNLQGAKSEKTVGPSELTEEDEIAKIKQPTSEDTSRWSNDQLDTILGKIEAQDIKLYQMLSADPDNDKAWLDIEEAISKFLGGDKVGAEILTDAIRQKRMEGWMALPARGIQIANDATDEVNWLTGISATGKDGVVSLLNNRRIKLDPQLRRIGLALLSRIPAKYLEHLTFNVDKTGAPGGEFIPWLKMAKVAMDSTDPAVAAHEISHYLAQFLTSKERGEVSAARAAEIDIARTDKANSEFFKWLDSVGGSATSSEYTKWRYGTEIDPRIVAARVFDTSKIDVETPAQMYRSSLYSVTDPLYHLINDDEFFAHYMSEAAAKAPVQIEGFFGKVREIVRRIFEAMKDWIGIRPDYWEQLMRKFERGEFLVHENGGMLFDKNNSTGAKSLPPIKDLPALRRYTAVDQGQEEAALIRTLTHEQNQPLVGHIRDLYNLLPRQVRSELPGLASRLAALVQVQRGGGPVGQTPLRHYAVLVNALALQEEGKALSGKIEQIVEEIQRQNKNNEKASMAEVRAKHLEQMAQSAISDYKDLLISEQRRATNDGVSQGLNEAIKTLDGIRDSTESLKRAIDFIAETVTLEQLNDQSLTTQQVVDIFKARIMELTGAPTWQQAVIPPGKDKPGVSNEQMRIAVRILQENQRLVQDLITYKELSDPEFAKIMREGEAEFDKHIASLTYRELRSFLKTYHSVRTAKDKARQVYIKHRARLKNLIEDLEIKVDAEDFLHAQVLNSTQFRSALSDAARHGFFSAEIYRDHNGSDVLKRTYYNPLNKEESIDIVDGTTREDYKRNWENYEKVLTWFEDALGDERLDPIDRQIIDFERARIVDQELENSAYDPFTGKRTDWFLNAPSSLLANLTGNSLQYAMSKIGGRAAVQGTAVFQARSEARRRVAEVRHELTFPMQRAILLAMKGHNITQERWVREVAEPILASYNSIGARQIKAMDITRYGHRVSGQDMEAVRAMKKFIDAMSSASKDMDLHTARLHPIKVKEVISGREILRDQQGGTELIVPRRFDKKFLHMLEGWVSAKNNRPAKDAVKDLIGYVQSGSTFNEMVLAHIYSTQRYPDYVNTTRFKSAYREIYNRILNGNPPLNFNEVLDIVFEEQSGTDAGSQMTKDEIAKEIIVGELDKMATTVLDQTSKDRAGDTPGQNVSVLSADNFMTKPRGNMIAPDSGYQYSVVNRSDIQWLSSSVLEVHEQMARDGLSKIQKMLEEYVTEWEDRAKHTDPQKESIERQLSGEDWMNYREAKQMLNQVRRLLDKTSPESFRTFIDEQFATTGRRVWSILIQSLLQSATVLKNNLFGMNLRLWQMEQQWRGNGLWMGMPKWLLKLPTMAKNGIYYPMRDLPAFIISGFAYKKGLKGVSVNVGGRNLFGEDALRAIIEEPSLANAAAAQVGGEILKRAVNVQRARDLGAAGDYGLRDQLARYVIMNEYGGEFESLDQTSVEKLKGRVNSLLGLFQETGGGLMLPKAVAPRKLEQFLNFQAIRHADRLLNELTLNLKEAIRDRTSTGINQNVTDAELLGDPSGRPGDALYMRKMFDRAGLNLDALIKRLESNPGRELLTPSEWNSFVLEVAKELNMPGADNRVTYRSGFARLMSSLMGYGMWYNERAAEAFARDSRKKFDVAAVYRAMFFIGTIAAMGVFVGTPLQRWLKRLFYNEEDQTGRFSADNTGWRNAGVLWEQTAPFWPIIGSVMNQLYDARTGGGKLFNFLPVTVAAQALQSANEIGQTGNVFYPTVKLIRQWLPNTKILLNRIPQTEGIMEVNSAGRILRQTAAGDVEVRTPKSGGAIKYSPISTQVQMAVNEMARDNPDYSSIRHYREDAVKLLMRKGASRKDAERRFDLSVLTRYPENTVFGRPLTPEERARQVGRMTPEQFQRLERVEGSFDRYATTFGLMAPSAQRKPRVKSSPGGSIIRVRGGRRRGGRLVRNRSLTRRRTRRLVRV